MDFFLEGAVPWDPSATDRLRAEVLYALMGTCGFWTPYVPPCSGGETLIQPPLQSGTTDDQTEKLRLTCGPLIPFDPADVEK